MLYAFGVGEVPISVSGDPQRPDALVHTVRAVGAVTQAICARASRATARRPRSVRQRLAGRPRPRAATWSSSPAGSASRRCGRRSTRALAERDRYRRVIAPLRRARPPSSCSTATSSSAGPRATTSSSGVTVDIAGADWRGQVGRRHEPDRARRPRPRARARSRRLRPRGDDALRGRGRWSSAGSRLDAIYVSLERNMKLRGRPLRPLPARRRASSAGTARCSRCDRRRAGSLAVQGADERRRRPKLAVWKFASCDGCQLSPARLRGRAAGARRRDRDRLLPRGDAGRRSRARTTSRSSRARSPRREDAERIREVRRGLARAWSRSAPARPRAGSRRCATSPTSTSSSSAVYAEPAVHLDARDLDPDPRPRPGRLRAAGLPDRQAPAARGDQRLPRRAPAADLAEYSVCIECKRRGNVCVMVAHGTPCLGPVTHAGCGALCPAYDRGCYGCFGPMETPNTGSLTAWWERLGVPDDRAGRRLPPVQRLGARVPGRERCA